MPSQEPRQCSGDLVDTLRGPGCSLGGDCQVIELKADREAYIQAHRDYAPPDWLTAEAD